MSQNLTIAASSHVESTDEKGFGASYHFQQLLRVKICVAFSEKCIDRINKMRVQLTKNGIVKKKSMFLTVLDMCISTRSRILIFGVNG